MLLSVVIPAYNCEKYINNCVESIMTQDIDKSEYEIIIVNDGSTDTTRQKCEELSKIYDNITVINTENHGLSCARNTGIEAAKGEYIEFVDSDDYIVHNMFGHLKKLVNEIDVELIYFEIKKVTELNDYSFNENLKAFVYDSSIELFGNMRVNNSPCPLWIKRQLLIDSGLRFVEGRYTEDGMFTCSLFAMAGKTVFWDIKGYRYFVNESGIVNKKERSHQKKVIDDFEFCICHLKDLYADMSEKTDNEKYLWQLQDRIGSYIFFLQVRMLTYGDYKLGKTVLNRLAERDLFPYKWVPYKKKFGIVYMLIRHKILYLAMLWIMDLKNRIIKKR